MIIDLVISKKKKENEPDRFKQSRNSRNEKQSLT